MLCVWHLRTAALEVQRVLWCCLDHNTSLSECCLCHTSAFMCRVKDHTHALSLHFTFILSSLALYFPVLLLIPFYLSSKYKLNSNKSFSLLAKSSYSLYRFILSLQLDFIFPYQEHSCTASGLQTLNDNEPFANNSHRIIMHAVFVSSY